MASLCSWLIAASVVVGQTDKPSNYQHLKEYGEIVAGRWVGDITLIADWPGFTKKKGDKLVSYTTIKWVLDNNALEQEEMIGEAIGKTLHYWDPASKRIVLQVVDSLGANNKAFIWKKDGVWMWENAGTLCDGRKMVGRGKMLVEDGGNTIIYEGTGRLGGEEMAPLRDVYHRVSKTAGN